MRVLLHPKLTLSVFRDVDGGRRHRVSNLVLRCDQNLQILQRHPRELGVGTRDSSGINRPAKYERGLSQNVGCTVFTVLEQEMSPGREWRIFKNHSSVFHCKERAER